MRNALQPVCPNTFLSRNCMQYISLPTYQETHAKHSLAQTHPTSWQMLFLNISSGNVKRLEGTGSHQGSLVQGHTNNELCQEQHQVDYPQSLLFHSLSSTTLKLWSCSEPGFTPATFYHFPLLKEGTAQVGAWNWTAACLSASPGAVYSYSWQHYPALPIRWENEE